MSANERRVIERCTSGGDGANFSGDECQLERVYEDKRNETENLFSRKCHVWMDESLHGADGGWGLDRRVVRFVLLRDHMRPGCRRGLHHPDMGRITGHASSFVSFWYDGGSQTSISGPPAYPGHVNLRVQCAHERHSPCLLRLASMQVRNPSTPSGQEAPPTSSPDSRIHPEDFHPGPAATRRLSWRSSGMPRVRLLRTRTALAMTLPFTFMTMTQHEKNDEQDTSVENVAAQTAEDMAPAQDAAPAKKTAKRTKAASTPSYEDETDDRDDEARLADEDEADEDADFDDEDDLDDGESDEDFDQSDDDSDDDDDDDDEDEDEDDEADDADSDDEGEDEDDEPAPLHADPFVEATDSSFAELGLIEPLVQALQRLDIIHPSPVQAQAIPVLLAGNDLVASAPTGTGKTAAFLLPALQGVALNAQERAAERHDAGDDDEDHRGKRGKGRRPARPTFGPSVLVLTPTRELAQQVTRTSHALSRLLPRTSTVCITGGSSYFHQARALAMPYEVLVATPGRLIDQLENGKIDLSRLKMLVLDEADRMLDMGFSDDVFRIAEMLPTERQTVCFTATVSHDVRNLADKLLKDPQWLTVERSEEALTPIDDHVVYVDNPGHRGQLLRACLNDTGLGQAIVFTATKRQAEELSEELQGEGFAVDALHGDMNQRERTRALNRLRQGECQVLIATDVAARGIDVSSLTHVINYELPRVAEDYVHRIGRTGRAGASGQAISFVGREDVIPLRKIEHFLGRHIQVSEFPGLEAQFKPQPFKKKHKKKEVRREGYDKPRFGGRGRDDRRGGDREYRGRGFQGRDDRDGTQGPRDRDERRGERSFGRRDDFRGGQDGYRDRKPWPRRDGEGLGPRRHDGERWSEDRPGRRFGGDENRRGGWRGREDRPQDGARGFRPEGRDGEGRRERPWNNDRREGRGWDASRGERGEGGQRERRPFDRDRREGGRAWEDRGDRGGWNRDRNNESRGFRGDRGEWKPRRDGEGQDRRSFGDRPGWKNRKPWEGGDRRDGEGRGNRGFGRRDDAGWRGRDDRRGGPDRGGRFGDRDARGGARKRGPATLDPDRAFRQARDEGKDD